MLPLIFIVYANYIVNIWHLYGAKMQETSFKFLTAIWVFLTAGRKTQTDRSAGGGRTRRVGLFRHEWNTKGRLTIVDVALAAGSCNFCRGYVAYAQRVAKSAHVAHTPRMTGRLTKVSLVHWEYEIGDVFLLFFLLANSPSFWQLYSLFSVRYRYHQSRWLLPSPALEEQQPGSIQSHAHTQWCGRPGWRGRRRKQPRTGLWLQWRQQQQRIRKCQCPGEPSAGGILSRRNAWIRGSRQTGFAFAIPHLGLHQCLRWTWLVGMMRLP